MRRKTQTRTYPTTRRSRAGRLAFLREQAKKRQSDKQAGAMIEFLELGRGKGGLDR